MIRGSRLFYPANRRVFDDPRSTFVIDDARAFLSASGPAFDFIVSEPSNPWVSGVSGLFTVEFYERVKSRLRPGGVFAQWFHLYEIDDASVASVVAGIDRVFGDYRIYVSSNSDLVIVASSGATLPPADWSVTRFPGACEGPSVFPAADSRDARRDGRRRAAKRSSPYLAGVRVNSDFDPFLDLNGERLRFRNMFANGFRELAEDRFDIAAAIEGRRRPLGSVLENPAPEIVRAAELARGARLRMARRYGASEITSDSALRADASLLAAFDRQLAGGEMPPDWNQWLTEFARAEAVLHGGSAGEADEPFYASVRQFLRVAKAPPGVNDAVTLHHGLAAWDFAEAAAAGDSLIAELRAGRRWIPTEIVRRGTAVAKLRLRDANGAGRVFTSLATLGGSWTMTDEALEAYVRTNLARSVPALRPPLQHHLVVDDHVPDDPLARFRKLADAVAEAIVGDDRRVEFARKRQDEVVGVGAGRCLPDRSRFDHVLVDPGIVDLMPQGGVGHDDRLESLLFQLVADREQVRHERLRRPPSSARRCCRRPGRRCSGPRAPPEGGVLRRRRRRWRWLLTHRPRPPRRGVDAESRRAESARTMAAASSLMRDWWACSMRTPRVASTARRSGSLAFPDKAAKSVIV